MDSQICEIKKFLYDIEDHLKSELKLVEYQNITKNSEVLEASSRRLLQECQNILQSFPQQIENFDCNRTEMDSINFINDSSYIDMSKKKKDDLPIDYVDCSNSNTIRNEVEKITSTADVGVYEVCNISTQNIIEECPFKGLPVAHLSIQKTPKQGNLLRIEKKLFFDQTKRYYCGIVKDWLLCYNEGINSMKPRICIHITGKTIESYNDGKKRNYQFQILDNNNPNEKYIFQCNTELETRDWMNALEICKKSSLKINYNINLNMNSINNNNERKLPTPPSINKFDDNNKKCSNLDEIYEEPCPLYDSDFKELFNEKMKENFKFGYDIPKINSINKNTNKNNDLDEINEQHQIEFQNKIKDVQNQLTNQLLINLKHDIKQKKILKTDSNEIKTTNNELITPVKSWLFNRINKSVVISTSTSTPKKIEKNLNKKRNEKENEINKITSQKDENIHQVDGINIIQTKSSLGSNKGGKVNMIIHQLESNGRLLNLTKNIESYTTNMNLDDISANDLNYEPVSSFSSFKT